MPLFDIYDKKTGQTTTVEGPVAPTPDIAAQLVSKARASFVGPIEGAAPPPPPATPAAALPPPHIEPQASGIGSMAQSALKFMGTPIAAHLPQWVQDKLGATSPMGPSAAEPNTVDFKSIDPNRAKYLAQHPDLLRPQPAAADFYKGAAAALTPSTAAAAATIPAGGPLALAGNALMGAEGGATALDPSKSTGERLMGGVTGLAGAAGAAGLLPGILAKYAAKAPAVAKPIAKGLRTVDELKAAAQAAKSPQELDLIKKELSALDFQDKLTKGMIGPEATKLKGVRDANVAQQQAAALKEADALSQSKALDAQGSRAAAQASASGTMEHFDNLGDSKALKEALATTKRASVAKSLQGLDEIAAKAGDTGAGSAPKYYAPKAEAPSVKAPSIDDVMFTPKQDEFATVAGKPKMSAAEFKRQGLSAAGETKPDIPKEVPYYKVEPPTPSSPSISDMDAMSKSAPKGVSETLAKTPKVKRPNPATQEPKPAIDQLLDTLAPKPKAGPPSFSDAGRTEDILRSNPRFQAAGTDKPLPEIYPGRPADLPGRAESDALRAQFPDRASRYKELGGIDKGQKEAGKIDPSKLYSGLDPSLAIGALKNPYVRAAIGGTIGYNSDDEKGHPLVKAVGGAIAGGMLGSKANRGGTEFLDLLRAHMYEGLLTGPAQLTNAVGNLSSLASAPISEALRGNTATAKSLLKYYAHPVEAAKEGLRGFKEGWQSGNNISRLGTEVKTVGYGGKTMRAVDSGTKAILHAGGLDPKMAETYTLSGNPATSAGKSLQSLQAKFPAMEAISPLVRTAINAIEMGAAHSPLRWLPEGTPLNFGTLAKELRAKVPAQEVQTRFGGAIPKHAMEALLGVMGAPAVAAGVMGKGPSSPLGMAALGPQAVAPYAFGHAVHDYHQYGKTKEADIGRALSNQVPALGDIPRATEGLTKLSAEILARPIPSGLMMVGDKTVRDTSGKTVMDVLENTLREKIPGWRETLPPKYTQLGKRMERNMLGQYPEPAYNTDPLSARLAEAGALRRGPDTDLGGISPEERLQLITKIMPLVAAHPEIKGLAEATTSMGKESLTPWQGSRLGELRGLSSKAALDQVWQAPWFKALPKELQDTLLKLTIEKASEKGTAQFKAEREAQAAKDYKAAKK